MRTARSCVLGQLLLKEVQDGLVVNNEVLSKSNSLFVVNGKSNVSRPMPVRLLEQGGGIQPLNNDLSSAAVL